MALPRAQPITKNDQRFWRKQKHQIFEEPNNVLNYVRLIKNKGE